MLERSGFETEKEMEKEKIHFLSLAKLQAGRNASSTNFLRNVGRWMWKVIFSIELPRGSREISNGQDL